jgi:hypothetical protein
MLKLEGVRFGTWTATDNIVHINGRANRVCYCDCGNIGAVLTSNLTGGKSNGCFSCGTKKASTVDGDSQISSEMYGLYTSYRCMMGRCYIASTNGYERYGGLGICVCDEWKSSYSIFKLWAVENGWKQNLVIDRVNSSLDYSPCNCRWITASENSKLANTGKIVASRILSNDDVKFIRSCKVGRKEMYTRKTLGEKFNISWQSINAIRSRKYYKDIKDDV